MELRKIQVENDDPEFISWVESAIFNIENYTLYSEEKKASIKEWLGEQYLSAGEIDREAHRANLLEKCVYVKPTNPDCCWECVDGYGPYPVTANDWACQKCNQTIDHCDKCLWIRSFKTEPPSILYGCQNCTKKWYPINATRVDRRFHRGDWCTQCSSNCEDCLTSLWCTECD